MAFEGISWHAPEFHYYEKTGRWYGAVGTAAGLVMLVALWQKNFLFAVFTAIATLVMFAWGRRRPRVVAFLLSGRGIAIEEKQTYPMERLKGFAVIEETHDPALGEIVFRTATPFNRWVRILVPREQLEAVGAVCRRSLREVEYAETMTEYFLRLLRF